MLTIWLGSSRRKSARSRCVGRAPLAARDNTEYERTRRPTSANRALAIVEPIARDRAVRNSISDARSDCCSRWVALGIGSHSDSGEEH